MMYVYVRKVCKVCTVIEERSYICWRESAVFKAGDHKEERTGQGAPLVRQKMERGSEATQDLKRLPTM